MKLNNKSGFALIGILIILAIIIISAAYLIPKYTGAGAPTEQKKVTPIEQAKGVDCINNLSQIRNAIQLYYTTNETYPPYLYSISQGMSSSIFKCPVSGNSYGYDSSNGRVYCTTPGHEKY
jgi:competence protein ComGC